MVPPANCFRILLFRPLVKRRLYYLRANKPPAYVNLDLLARACVLGRNVSEADVLLEKRRRTARRYFTNALVVDDYFLIVARDAAVRDFKPNQLSFHALGFLLGQGFAADEVAFIEFTNPAEVCFEQRGGFVDLVAVERESGFEPERVAGSETAGQHALVAAEVSGVKDSGPQSLGMFGRRVDFEAV